MLSLYNKKDKIQEKVSVFCCKDKTEIKEQISFYKDNEIILFCAHQIWWIDHYGQ